MTALAHGIIYSESYMKEFIKDASHGKIKHCDAYWNDGRFTNYAYYKPIMYQTFPETENMKEWGLGEHLKTTNNWLKAWDLNHSTKNYQNHAIFSYKIPWIVLIFIIVLVSLITSAILYHNRKRLFNNKISKSKISNKR